MSFIDDTSLAVMSRSLELNIAFLQAQYPQWKATFRLLQLNLEDNKMELFHVRAYETHVKGKPLYQGPLPSLPIHTDDGTIQIVKPQTAWQYLGFIFDPNLNFKTHVERWVTKGSTMLRACKMLGNTQRGLTPKDKWLIYITTALPILSYRYQLWF